MRIRSGRLEDADTIAECQSQMALETEGLRLDRATVSAGVRAVFDDPTKGHYWLAEVDGQVAGCLLIVPEWSDWRNGTVWWIHSLYVREQFRRRGVFSGLFAHLKRLVEADDSLIGLRLYVAKHNVPAHKTYESLGMNADDYDLYEWLK